MIHRILSGLFISGALFAGYGASLQVGHPAPKLAPGHWVQGEPVKEFEKGKIYLVEFWATWCGPCIQSIPHVNELHHKFKDRGLVVIGQSVWESDPQAVEPFLKKMGSKMTYRVATDTAEGTMAKTWMEAAGQRGIPASFVVDQQGDIVWIGHPMTLKEELLEKVLSGHFDKAAAAAEHAERVKSEATMRALWRDLNTHRASKDWQKADAILREMEKLSPEARMQAEFARFQMLLQRNDSKAVSALAEKIAKERADEPMVLNQLAWSIATHEELGDRDLALAERIARLAFEKTEGKNAEILDTLARALFLQGRKDEAIGYQEKAVRFAEGGRQKQFARNLRDYKTGVTPNEARFARLQQEMNGALEAGEWGEARQKLAELEKIYLPEDWALVEAALFRIYCGEEKHSQAELSARKLAKSADDPLFLNDLAWSVAISEKAAGRDFELAEIIAAAASEATKNENAEILDTLARLLFRKGDKSKAVEVQARAVEFAGAGRKASFAKTLDSYKAGELPPAE